jgi:hypothetical protein
MAVARQWFDKHIPVGMNTHRTIEELLDMVISMQFVSYQILDM